MWEEEILMDRELSWLDFNRRVLSLAKDKNVPLAEQMKFLAIYGSNLDEFFMVRVGALQDRILLKKSKKEKVVPQESPTAAEQLSHILAKVGALAVDCDKYYTRVLASLAACGYVKLDFDKLTKTDERFWKKYFEAELFPVLSPQIVDPSHPFPFLRSRETYLGVLLRDKHGDKSRLGIIPISSQVEHLRFLKKDGVTYFGLTEELIAHFAERVFGKETLAEKCLFRVTRNADINVGEGRMNPDIDYRDVMAELLKKRRKLAAVRLQLTPNAPPEITKLLCERLGLSARRCFAQKSPLDQSFFTKLYDRLCADGHTELCYAPARPLMPPPGYDLTEVVRRRDVLLSYPYQSIRPFLTMLQKAAADPEVVSIKMTLYRMARESQIVQALVAAAENGKEVVALVELRARFDEQNNIDWSRHLEQAGCTVIYGFDEYKVHSKLTLITRRTKDGYSYLTQIGTGNYNEKTSELYADYSFLSADRSLGEEAAAVFQRLAVRQLTESTDTLLVAPLCFKTPLLAELDRLIAAARMGRSARAILKNNSLNDRDIIEKLREASGAGVRVDLIIRGICCIRAGVPGETENIHVRSLVGRYLEHGRVYCFEDGAETRMYIASGDFLTRNTECRVEVGVRIRDEALVKKLHAILTLQLSDNVNARVMQPDGSYQKEKPAEGEALVDSQLGMFALLRDDWGEVGAGTVPTELAAPTEEKTPVAEPPADRPMTEPEKKTGAVETTAPATPAPRPTAPAAPAPKPTAPAAPAPKPTAPAAPAPKPTAPTAPAPKSTAPAAPAPKPTAPAAPAPKAIAPATPAPKPTAPAAPSHAAKAAPRTNPQRSFLAGLRAFFRRH